MTEEGIWWNYSHYNEKDIIQSEALDGTLRLQKPGHRGPLMMS